MGAFICPHCKTHNACTCTNCSKHITKDDTPVGWTDDGEGLICGKCHKTFSPDEFLEEESIEINRETILQEVINQLRLDLNDLDGIKVIEEFLRTIPIENHLAYLPDNTSKVLKNLKIWSTV